MEAAKEEAADASVSAEQLQKDKANHCWRQEKGQHAKRVEEILAFE